MTRNDAIAEGLLSTKPGMTRYLAGFDETNCTRQAPNLPNHAVWCLGHLAFTMYKVAGLIDSGAVPESEFIKGGHVSGGGDARRFAIESVAFASKPLDTPREYPGLARSIEIYSNAVDRIAQAVRHADDAALDKEIQWGATPSIPLWLLAIRMIGHNGTHIGQITDLRRALGFKGILG